MGENNNEETEGYKAPEGFKEFTKKEDSLVDILNVKSSSEFWLIQCPFNYPLDMDDGQEISLKLDDDGVLGSFQGSSGKSYDVVSLTEHSANATVFLPSTSGEPIIAGKISRYISLVHYPEPSELEKQKESSEKQKYGKSSTNHPSYMTPTKSVRPSSSKSTSTYISRHKSSLSEAKEASKSKKRKPVKEQSRSTGQSTLDSGRGPTSSSGSLHSSERKSKKKENKA